MNRLDKIEARANAATEGPWEVKPYNGWHDASDEIDSFVGPSDATIVEQLGCGCCDVGLEVSPTDAEFIAHARTDVPALIAALRAVLKLHKEDGHGWGPGESFCTECQQGYGLLVPYPCPTVTAIRQHLGDEQ